MGRFFGEQAGRLLREKWKSVLELAEELFAMSQVRGPLVANDPLILNISADSGVSPIQIRYTGDLPPITVVHGDDTMSLTDAEDEAVNPIQPGSEPPPATASVFLGTVTGGGPGVGPYSVQLVGGSTVSVLQQQIDAAETVAAGTVVYVVLVSGIYRMQAPVWQE